MRKNRTIVVSLMGYLYSVTETRLIRVLADASIGRRSITQDMLEKAGAKRIYSDIDLANGDETIVIREALADLAVRPYAQAAYRRQRKV